MRRTKRLSIALLAGAVLAAAAVVRLLPGRGSAMPEGGDAGENRRISLRGIPLEMVWIPAGEFLMGSPETEVDRQEDESPVHRVRIGRGFWMSRHEITQAQWSAVMERNPSWFKGGDIPAARMTWNDCQIFLDRVNRLGLGGRFRLPTEAEWEYACRAGTRTVFHFGDRLAVDMANFDGNYPYNAPTGTYRQTILRVGSFGPNAWGLHDMHGNVGEWCSDWYEITYYARSPSDDPPGAGKGWSRVVRGGTWDDAAKYCRSAMRKRLEPDRTNPDFGFRLVWGVR